MTGGDTGHLTRAPAIRRQETLPRWEVVNCDEKTESSGVVSGVRRRRLRRCRGLAKAPRITQRLPKQELDLSIQTTKIIGGPALHGVQHVGVHA